MITPQTLDPCDEPTQPIAVVQPPAGLTRLCFRCGRPRTYPGASPRLTWCTCTVTRNDSKRAA